MRKVSIALCTYNGAKFLSEQLESFLTQTRLPDELVVCDDFSSDQSVRIVEDFARKAPFAVKIFRNEKNLGVIKNFEKAISLCTGEIIFLSDQDDFWMPNKIALVLEQFDKSEDIGMVFSNTELVDEQLEHIGLYLSDVTFTDKMRRLDSSDKFAEELLKRNYITGATLAFRSHFREKLLPFPENIPEMIHDAWIAFVIYVSAQYSYIKTPLVKYRQHSRQQIGLTTGNSREKLSRDEIYSFSIKILQSEQERVEKILRELKHRPGLKNILNRIEPTVLKVQRELNESIIHLENRRLLPENKILRFKAIVRELLSKRYNRYSKGFLSAGKDFLENRNLIDIRRIFAKFKGIKSKLKIRWQKQISEKLYQKWINETEHTQTIERLATLNFVSASAFKPLISVVMPVYNVDERWLRLAIESVLAQSYSNWELCIADDNSSAAHIKPLLEEYSAKDSRIKVVYRNHNGHIAAASNSALEISGGDYVALLDHDDELAQDALLYVVKEILDNPQVALIYTDEDKIDQNNRRSDAAFKPGWSTDLLYSLNLVTHLSVFKRSILIKTGGFSENVDGSQDYDLVLRFIEQIDESQIRHIPRILYHWRAIEGSVALDSNHKNYAHDAARQAIRAHFERKGIEATVTQGFADYHRVIYELPTPAPKVSIILETDELDDIFKGSLDVLFSNSAYRDFEVLIGSGGKNIAGFSDEVKFFDSEERINFVSLSIEKKLRAKRLNTIVQKSSGTILLFMEANSIPLNKDWLRELASQAYRNEIGAAGGKILYKDERVRSAGYILGINDVCGRAHHLLPREAAGNFARLQVINNFSAVSAECLAVKRKDFFALNGFDEQNFPRDLFDVDFCLRLEAQGRRNLLTPYAEIKQLSLPEKREISLIERQILFLRWQDKVNNDPFYNPNLTRRNESFQVEYPPRFF